MKKISDSNREIKYVWGAVEMVILDLYRLAIQESALELSAVLQAQWGTSNYKLIYSLFLVSFFFFVFLVFPWYRHPQQAILGKGDVERDKGTWGKHLMRCGGCSGG